MTGGNGERLFDRLYFLRGFENLMIDFATDAPELSKLIDMLSDYEMKLVNKWLEIGVDVPLKNIEAICEAMEEYCWH